MQIFYIDLLSRYILLVIKFHVSIPCLFYLEIFSSNDSFVFLSFSLILLLIQSLILMAVFNP